MDSKTAESALTLVRQARLRADAIIVVAFLPGGDVIYECDSRITIPDLHGLLQGSNDFICQCVARRRAALLNERPTR
jgi:hypothetical protein